MTFRKKFFYLFMFLLASVFGWRFFARTDSKTETGPGDRQRAIPVETTPVRRDTVRVSSRFSGELQPRTGFAVAPRVAGRLKNLYVDIGDVVTNGQLIAVLDDEEYVQQLEQMRAERDVADANLAESISALAIAERDLERVASLHRQEVVSDTERDTAQARHDAAAARRRVSSAQRDQREAALSASRIRLSYTRIHAAWEDAGARRVVGERFVHQGALLAAGQSIVSILDVNRLVAVVFVVERDYTKVLPGQAVRVVADARPDEEFAGTVARVAPLVSERSRQARVEIDLPNPEHRLRPGMFVRAEIVFDIAQDACVVPVAALTRRGGQTGVFTVDETDMNVSFVPVSVGAGDRDKVQILGPPLSGSVVTLGQHLLNDGSAIRIVE